MEKRVLTFGLEGSGKSSMIKCLLDLQSNGITMLQDVYVEEHPPFSHKDITWTFVDVGDLSIQQSGT